MKILFVGFGLTPYFRDFLNLLNRQKNVAVANIRPEGDNPDIEPGVYQEFDQIQFKDIACSHCAVPAHRLLRLPDLEWKPPFESFLGLPAILREWQPDIVVVSIRYQSAFCFDPKIVAAVRGIDAKIVFHSIPFQLPFYNDALNSLEIPSRLPMKSLPKAIRRIVQLVCLDRLYISYIRRRTLTNTINNQRHVYQRADAHAVYFEGGIEIYSSWGVPEGKIHVVRNSPNTEALLTAADRFPSNPVGNRIIHVGRLVAWKRVDLLIHAVSRLRNSGFPETELLVVGYGPCDKDLRLLVDELGLQHAVKFVGGVYDPNQLARLFSECSAYVLAGMGGLSINEAMCFSMPIVCCRGDGTEKFLVRHGANGLLFEEGSLDSLVASIQEVFSNTERALRMGKESRRIIEQELNTHVHVANYIKMFECLLKS